MQIENNSSPILSFFPRFIVALITLQFIVLAIHSSPEVSSVIQIVLTQMVAWVHEALGTSFTMNGNVLTHQDSLHYVIVDNECTGLMLLASVCAAIIGFSRSVLNTLKMIIIAVIILQVENVIRISHLFFEIQLPENNFEFYHLYFWQLVNFLTGLSVIFLLERKFNNTKALDE